MHFKTCSWTHKREKSVDKIFIRNPSIDSTHTKFLRLHHKKRLTNLQKAVIYVTLGAINNSHYNEKGNILETLDVALTQAKKNK